MSSVRNLQVYWTIADFFLFLLFLTHDIADLIQSHMRTIVT